MYNFTGKSPWCTGKKTDLTNSSIISQIVPLQMYVKLNYTKNVHIHLCYCVFVCMNVECLEYISIVHQGPSHFFRTNTKTSCKSHTILLQVSSHSHYHCFQTFGISKVFNITVITNIFK